MSKERITCPCGAVYEKTTEKLIWRDNDQARCESCDRVLAEWNGSRVPRFRLVSPGRRACDGSR